MDESTLEEIIGVFKSRTRRLVIELLLKHPNGQRFSEISRTLKIYPSTLEKHLKKLVESKAITHFENRYIATASTIIIWQKFRNLETTRLESYHESHYLPIENHELRNDFGSLSFEVIPDLITIVNRIKTDFSNSRGLVQAGGNLEYQIGKSIYGKGLLDHKNTRVELILPRQLISEIKNHDEENLFLHKFDQQTTWMYVIEDCKLGLGVDENSGFLFLPNLNSSSDYNQCLYTRNADAIKWLRSVFEQLKIKSNVFVP